MMNACMNGIKDMAGMIVIVFAAYMVRDSLVAIGLRNMWWLQRVHS